MTEKEGAVSASELDHAFWDEEDRRTETAVSADHTPPLILAN